MLKKLSLLLLWGIYLLGGVLLADEYHYFYGEGCSYCAKTQRYFEANHIEDTYKIIKYEIRSHPENLQILEDKLAQINLPITETKIPLMFVEKEDKIQTSLIGPAEIINYFEKGERVWEATNQTWTQPSLADNDKNSEQSPWKFIGILIPTALSDSINPCAFAVMLLLLSTILSKSKSRKRTIFSGVLFSLAIFLSYFLMGIWVFKLLATSTAETSVFKWIIGVIWILIWLANIKNYFWYGKVFLMEVPRQWRPTMMKLIQWVLSPIGAFGIGILVSLFLLPCSSGPYIVILGLLSAQSNELNLLGMGYLALYNFIFILPMLAITFLVWTGKSSVEKLAKLKNKNTKLIHLGVGILMLILGGYIISSIYF